MEFIINITEQCHEHHHEYRYRLYPKFGLVTEQSGPVAPTPHHYHRPMHGVPLMATSKISDSQQVPLAIGFQDKKLNPAPQPAGTTVEWSVDNPALLALTPSADTLTCVVKAVGPLGTGTVTVKALDATQTTLAAGTIDIEVDAGTATAISVTAGTPVEQP